MGAERRLHGTGYLFGHGGGAGDERVYSSIGDPVEYEVRRVPAAVAECVCPARVLQSGGSHEDTNAPVLRWRRSYEVHPLDGCESLIGRRRLELAQRAHL